MGGSTKRAFSERKSTYKFVSENVVKSQANHDDDGSTLDQFGALVGAESRKDCVGNIIMIDAGEDFAEKILSFFQDCGCEGFIMSASGCISRPTLNEGGSAVSYEGTHAILNVRSHYSFDCNGQVKQNGSLGISLADSEGNVVFGYAAGSLTAASRIQVVVALFLNDDDGKE